MDIIRQRLVGKPHSAIIDELTRAMYHDYNIASIIAHDFRSLIYQKDILKILYYAVLLCNCDMFMYIMDDYSYSKNDADKVKKCALFLVQQKDIPVKYITRFFEANADILVGISMPNNICVERMIVGIDAISNVMETLPLETALLYQFRSGSVKCLGELIIRHIRCPEPIYRYMREYIAMYYDLKTEYRSVRRHHEIIRVCANKYPSAVYNYMNQYQDDVSCGGLKILRYVIMRCTTDELHNVRIERILNYTHYLCLFDKNIDNKTLNVMMMRSLRMSHDDIKMIATHMCMNGYSLFQKRNTNIMPYGYKLYFIFMAKQFSCIDDIAVEYLRSIECRHTAEELLHHRTNTPDDLELLTNVLEKYHQN